MKVIHIESGLGNQMLSFSEYLVIKKLNPDDTCYIETIIYEIPECNSVISQWNGYELERIFGIHAPNIKELYSKEEWKQIIEEVRETRFWDNGWRYAPAICEVLCNHGLKLVNIIGDDPKYIRPNTSTIKYKVMNTRLIYDIKRLTRPLYREAYVKKFMQDDKIFIKSSENVFAGQNLGLRNVGSNINFICDEIRKSFSFPPLTDEKNLEILKIINGTHSVAIHARRGDMLQSNGYCYKYGYFKRSVKYIRKKVKDPVFFFFCDSGSIEWCKNNYSIFGLNNRTDRIYYVDWNTGENAYKDIQLMAACKHNIITNSSFGWWGTFFNNYPDKITCSPNLWNNTTNHF